MAGEHQFLDRVLAGIASLGVGPRGTQVELELTGAAGVAQTVATYGVGDVRGLDRSAVVRCEPPPGSLGFEPTMFAVIELAHPALPWLLAPAARLPWLVLVVVEDRAGVRIESTPNGRVLAIDAPAQIARELPDLDEAWAWAHAYGTGASGDPIDPNAFARGSGPTAARLVCPRRLAERTRYFAALVPATAAGVRAGLGESGGDDGPAWTTTTPLPLRLPAFVDWSFTTGDGGDFASLARALVPRQLAAEDGVQIVDATDPGWSIARVEGRDVRIGGLLRPRGERPLPTEAMVALGEEISDLVDAAVTVTDTPVFAPPAYGSFATGVESSAAAPAWQSALARDLELRAAAGFGTEIVRRRQDELVDEAWRQLGDAEPANRAIRFAELAAAVSRRMFARHIDALASDAAVLQITALAHRRIAPGVTTVASELANSVVPTRSTSAAFRRQLRAGGKLSQRAGTNAAHAIVERTNRDLRAPDRIDVVPVKSTPHGVAAFDAISKDVELEPRLASARVNVVAANAAHWRGRVRTPVTEPTRVLSRGPRDRGGPQPLPPLPRPPRAPHVDPADEPFVPSLPSHGGIKRATIDAFELAARRHQQYLVEHLAAIPRTPPRPTFGALGTVRGILRADIASAATLAAALDARISGGTVTGTFQPLSITPVFERALVDDVKAIDLARLMPGLTDIVANTVAICVPDHDAIRALLVGANHELSAELSWRRFPGALDQLLLRTFWGRIVRDATGRFVRDPDLPAIGAWPDAGPPPPPVGLAVVIRGELIARYPSAIVSLVEAKWTGAFRVVGDGAPQHASVRIALAPDMALFAFPQTEDVVLGGDVPSGPPGWYVAIEEAPHAPRFGLAASATGPLAKWRELAWQHLVDGDLRGTHVRAGGPLSSVTLAGEPLRWGSHGAAQAAITLRRPTRIAIHASRLLRPGAG